MLLALLACVHHLPPEAACAEGDVAACQEAAAALTDPALSWQLLRYACEEGQAPACVVSGGRYAALGVVHEARPDGAIGAAIDYARACGLGLAEACSLAAALPDDPSGRAEIGAAAQRACRGGDEAACARLTRMGWRNAEITGVRRVLSDLRPLAVLQGGTVLGLSGSDIVAEGPGGPFQAPILSPAVPTLERLQVTMDGRILARAPDMVWSVLDGRAYAARAWPAAGDVSTFTPDGGIFAETVASSPLVSWWDLRKGSAGAAIDVGEPATSLALSPDGRWIAAAGPGGAVLADRVTEKVVVKLPCAAPIQFAPDGERLVCRGSAGIAVVSRTGKVGRNVAAAADAPFALSPDGGVLAVARPGAVLLYDAGSEHLGELRAEVALPPVGAATLLWSPDGGRLLVSGPDGALVVSRTLARDDAATDKAIVQSLRSPPDRPVGGLSLREDGKVQGQVTVGGEPARSATVSALPCTPGPGAPAATKADLQGRYTLAHLARGCWQVRATVGDQIATAQAVARAQPGATDLALPAQVTLAGRLRLANGRPAAGAHVAVAGGSPVVADARGKFALTATSEAVQVLAWTDDAWGKAELAGQDPAKLDLKLDTPQALLHARVAAAPNGPQDLTIRAPADVQVLPEEGGWLLLGAAPAASLNLRAARADLAGEPVTVTATAGATIEVPGVGRGTIEVRVPRRQSDDVIQVSGAACAPTADGCRTGLLPAGRYTVLVHRGNHQVGREEIPLHAGEDALVAPTLGGEVVRGRVLDAETGAPLAGVRVTADCAPGLASVVETKTNLEGYFQLSGLLLGRGHTLRANADAAGDFRRLDQTFDVTGDPALGELRLSRATEGATSGAVPRLADALRAADGDPLRVPELLTLLSAADAGDAGARATVAAVWRTVAPPPEPKR